MRETKPLQLSTMLSKAYSYFRVDFREVRIDRSFLYIADLGWRPTEPNEPNIANTFVMNMTEKLAKQTQRTYHNCCQSVTAILTPICRKFGWEVSLYHEFGLRGNVSCSLFPVPYSLFPVPCSLFPARKRTRQP